MFNSESFLLLPIDLIWIFTRLYQQLVNTKKEHEQDFRDILLKHIGSHDTGPLTMRRFRRNEINFVAFELCTLIELSSFGNQQFKKGLSNMKILKDLV